jgi:hypothetical protein
MSAVEETDGPSTHDEHHVVDDLAPLKDPVDVDEVAALGDAVGVVDEKTADEAAVEAAVGEEASVLISEAAAGMFCFNLFVLCRSI